MQTLYYGIRRSGYDPTTRVFLSAVPAYMKLEPGSEKDIQLLIKSLSDLDSHIFLFFILVGGVKLNFIPRQIDIPAF
jgi:hypothetical protein